MKTKLIINPTAGRGRARKAIPRIKEIFRNRKIDFHTSVTDYYNQATHLAKEASLNGFELIIAAGGDGTVNEVVNGMLESKSCLGVIPLGIGNDFARALNMPFELEKACDIICKDFELKTIDAGKINERYFINGIGIGFDAWVARESRWIRRFSFPGCVYFFAVISTLFKYKTSSLRINFDDTVLEKKILLVAIGNGKSSGAGFLLTPEAEIDDGLIDVCVVDDISRLKILMHLPRAIKGTLETLPYVKTFKTKKLSIQSRDSLLAHVDGELLESCDYQIQVLPKKLKVIIPK
ncbi:MAG: diacylglycerol kinase family lipid kinase [Candidatus Omnitrophica bacterium]|nr:diacylglycerol kinase family lipid kinase [Candidatus Omnitrophota bacterium]MBU1871932.1 diacylglycerol kinase family lipid kinase [Candidatus Omnitrophota bacterium]